MPFVVWPAVVSRGILVLLAFVHEPTGFFVVSSLFYLVANLNGPAYAGIMLSNYGNENRGRLMGALRIEVMAIAAVCSSLAALFLANEAVFRWLFPVAGAFGVLGSLIFGRIKVRRIPGFSRTSAPISLRASLAIVGKNAAFLLFMGILLLCAGPDKLAVSIEPIRFVDELGIDYRGTSFILGTVVSVFSIIGYYLWARALRRMSPFAIVSIVALLGAARTAVIAAAVTLAWLIPAGALLGLANAGWDLAPLFCVIALADPVNFSLYFGFHTTLVGVRGVIGPAIGTLLYSTGALSASGIFWMISGLTAAGGLAMAWFSRRLKARPSMARRL
jgi:hypothetical protein